MVAAVVVAPLAAVGFLTGISVGAVSWGRGSGDVALVAFGGAALVLALRWRLVGDAVCAPLAAAAAVAGLAVVPGVGHVGDGVAFAATLRLAGAGVVVALMWRALSSPEVRSDLHPIRSIAVALAVVAALSVLSSPVGLHIVTGRVASIRTTDLVEAVAAVSLAGVLLAAAIHRRRLLLVGAAAMVLAVGASSAVVGLHPPGPWSELPPTFLLVGAVIMVVAALSDVQQAISAVVLHDVRGSRRWEAAEAQLLAVRETFQGQRHDVRNMLAAIDGTLLVVATARQGLPDADVDRLLEAVRREVHWLQVLVGGDGDARSYDVSELLEALTSVHTAGRRGLTIDIEPDLAVHGRPDRLAVAVDNLLLNTAVHAPGAQVTLRARRVTRAGRPFVEVAIIDDGPGIPVAELERACRRGWRGPGAHVRPGNGLGLAQCRELVAAEGGSLVLEATGSHGPGAQRGLTARIQLPVHAPDASRICNFADGTAAPSS